MALFDFLKRDVAPGGTVVNLRTIKSGGRVEYDTAQVQYDAWGQPFVTFGSIFTVILKSDGTAPNWPYKTIWKHVSGPPVDFKRARDPDAW